MPRPKRPTPPINGEVLYQARQQLGLTQIRVTERTRDAGCEIDDSNLSKLERGITRWPTIRVQQVLGRVYGLTSEQMFAPCATCGEPWSESCMEHAPAETAGTKPQPRASAA